jgi:hypothetical protein
MGKKLEADYLVVGGGAMGMAFTDVLLNETNASVVMVDRYHQPGGHWNVAYPFVRLHQPSAFYGVNSKHLGSDRIDETGWNKGLYELATAGEVCAYFDQVMQQQFLPSGRLRYFPMSDYEGNGSFRSKLDGQLHEADVGKVVDATYMHVTVPAMRAPAYEVDEGVNCVPPNGLVRLAGAFDRYVVVGAGKTGMDACLFLLRNHVDPAAISWIMPRDSWMLDRANIQPGELFSESLARGFARQLEETAKAESPEDLLERMAACGQLIRFDDSVWPTMYRCATVTRAEHEQLKRIDDVIRKGRVRRIRPDAIELDEGEVPTSATTLHVDCTADGLERRPAVPVFADGTISLQSVRTCQQVFSAAFIGHVEAAYDDEAAKNELCTPVPHPDSEIDFLRTSLANGTNAARWAMDPALQQWLAAARLDAFTPANLEQPSAAQLEIARIVMENAGPALENLQRLLAAHDPSGTQS